MALGQINLNPTSNVHSSSKHFWEGVERCQIFGKYFILEIHWSQVGCIFRSTPHAGCNHHHQDHYIFRIRNRNRLHLQLLLRVDLRCISFPSTRSPVATMCKERIAGTPYYCPPKKNKSRLIPNLSSPISKKWWIRILQQKTRHVSLNSLTQG